MIYGDWIGRWGAAFTDDEALVDAINGRRYTYGLLSAEVNRMARFLADRLGIVKGHRVACLSLNRPEYIILFLALSRLGAILVPLNFRLAKGEFVYFLEDAAPEAIFSIANISRLYRRSKAIFGYLTMSAWTMITPWGWPCPVSGTTLPIANRLTRISRPLIHS